MPQAPLNYGNSPSYKNTIEKVTRQQELATNRVLEISKSATRMQDFADSHKYLRDLTKQMTVTDKITDMASSAIRMQDFVDSNQYVRDLAKQMTVTDKFTNMASSAIRMQDVLGSNQIARDMIKQMNAADSITETLAAAHKSALGFMRTMDHDFSQLSNLQDSAKKLIRDSSLQLASAERLMAGIDFAAIGSRFQIELPFISDLERTIARATTAYGKLTDATLKIPAITELPGFVFPGATREIYTTSLVIKSLSPWVEQEEVESEAEVKIVAQAERETSDCIYLLRQVDPGFARLYIGARNALHDRNPDRARHFLISLRELWSHLLRQLAPDSIVSEWVSSVSNQADLLHEDKPTRRARLLYICRELNSDPAGDFLIHNTQAVQELFKLFNLVHKLELKLSDEQLRDILLKTDSSLMYLLQVAMGDSR